MRISGLARERFEPGAKDFRDLVGMYRRNDEDLRPRRARDAQAAAANARTHRNERRARSDLEALVEISPVGILVFHARIGHPVPFHREARRIVERLRTAGAFGSSATARGLARPARVRKRAPPAS